MLIRTRSNACGLALIFFWVGCVEAADYEGLSCDVHGGCPDDFRCTEARVCTRFPAAPPSDDAVEAGGSETDASPSPVRDGGVSGSEGGASGIEGSGIDGGPRDPDGLRLSVNGSAIDTHLTRSGDVTHAQDLSRASISALVLDPSGQGFMTFLGSGTVEGQFLIPDVPEREYYLHANLEYHSPESVRFDYYLVTDARTVDLGAFMRGRPSQRPVTTTTNLALRVSNLAPWQPNDWLSLSSPNANGFEHDLGSRGLRLLSGASSITATLEYSRVRSPAAIVAPAGDTLYLGHLAPAFSSLGEQYYALTQLLSSETLSLDGGTGTLAGAFTGVARDQTARVRFCRSMYGAMASDVSPGARAPAPDEDFWPVSIEVSPFGGSRDIRPLSPEGPWILAQLRAAAVATDIDLGSVSYGNPFPAEWPTLGRLRAWFLVPRSVGGAAPFQQQITFEVEAPVDQLAALGCAPPLGPPRAPRIDGADAFVDRRAPGRLTPTLTWTPPSVGRANAYWVWVNELSASGGQTQLTARALIHTDLPRVVIPPGVLQAGRSYDFEIGAMLRSGSQVRVAPFQPSRPLATASTISGIYTP